MSEDYETQAVLVVRYDPARFEGPKAVAAFLHTLAVELPAGEGGIADVSTYTSPTEAGGGA